MLLLLAQERAVFPPNLDLLEKGSIFGISIFGSIRNIGIVDQISNGIVRAHAVIGQFDIAFAIGGDASTINHERMAVLKEQPELLNGSWAKGKSIAFTGDLDPKSDESIRKIDALLKGLSPVASKALLNKFEAEISETLAYMNYEANNPEPELQFRGP